MRALPMTVIFAPALALSGCGDSGPAGPAGAAGAVGPTGAAGPAGAPGADLNWIEVAGTSAQAASNTGYVAQSSSQVTITLPANASVGDLIEVSGVGSGGWKIAQNAGQQIYVGFQNGEWTAATPSLQWTTLVGSADGNLLAAAAYGGAIYTSTDDGSTWTPQNSGNHYWDSLALSADGTHLVASYYGNGMTQLALSADSGQTWTPSGPSLYWQIVGISPDGTLIVASAYDSNGNGWIYRSADGGATWSQTSGYFNSNPVAWPTATELLAIGNTNTNLGGQVFRSADGGASWTTLQATPSLGSWVALAASSDGKQIYASNPNVGLATSSDAGAHWQVDGTHAFQRLGTSPDGTALLGIYGTAEWVSTDSGQNWTELQELGVQPTQVLVTDDDQRLVGAINGGPISTLSAVSTAGATGFVTGVQYQSVTLQYEGNGTFLVVGNEGQLGVK